MKRKLTPLLALVLTLLAPATASAQTPLQYDSLNSLFQLNIFEPKQQITLGPVEPEPTPEPVKPKKVEPVVYIVVSGDNLTKIGTEHNVEWQRLWAKNTQLKHPDVIHVGDKITIPLKDEQLAREIPAAVQLPTITPGVVKAPTARSNAATSYDGGNTYSYGYCTWYVKNRRGASLPNGLGNANTWYARARANGMAVGSTPQAGAVGTTTRGALGHVVYVESVNGDGTITISEMNASAGWGNSNTRTASASEFVYIY
jgi:surface antigen